MPLAGSPSDASFPGMLPFMRRRRTRHCPRFFWAWTLTITAALLAVVWVGSMLTRSRAVFSPRLALYLDQGRAVLESSDKDYPSPYNSPSFIDSGSNHRWWFDTAPWSVLMPQRNYKTVWGRSCRIPFWPFVLLTGVPGVWMLAKTRRRTNPDACPACGYDRAGLPQTSSGPAPCPECGKGKNDAR